MRCSGFFDDEFQLPAPLKLDDPAWVAYRLAEILPIEMAERQALLEMKAVAERFARLREILVKQGVVT
jgi:Lon protease-like protein